ncbi:MAG: enoyl-CoA hydratase-related protein [Actinomycetota bacterium]|nr:enoyl-CoA hydratase-related protein [Actinomycetota bacterium]
MSDLDTSTSLVSLSIDGHVATIRLERPQALNAISGALADELAATARDVASNNDVWVVILAAAGEKAFCVGADLKERAGFTLDDYHANRKQVRGVFEALRAIPQPTIAAVFGFALGGGCELALSCDLIVAAERTQLGLPEARVGLLPAGGGTQLLTRKLGPARAKELIFTGGRFSAEDGHRWGLVARVVPFEDLDRAATELAIEISKSSPTAVREAKRSVDSALGVPIDEGIEIENDAWRVVIETEDRREGIAAFNEKRAPEWKNR